MSNSNIRKMIENIVKEEVAKKKVALAEARGFQGSKGVDDVFSLVTDKEDFGRWVKTKMKNTIPAEIPNSKVVDYLDKNPGSTTISASQLVDMYRNKGSLANAMSSKRVDKELQVVDKAMKAGQLQTGGAASAGLDTLHTFDDIGRELGVSKQSATNIYDLAVQKLGFLTNKIDLRDMDEDDLADLMDKIQNTTDEAAVKVAKIARVSANPEAFASSLVKAVGENPGTGPEIKELLDIAKSSEDGVLVAAQVLSDDLLDNSSSTIFKFFQEIIAKIFLKEKDAEQVASGLKGKRGRPSLDVMKQRAAAGDQKAIDYLAARDAKNKS